MSVLRPDCVEPLELERYRGWHAALVPAFLAISFARKAQVAGLPSVLPSSVSRALFRVQGASGLP